MPQPSTPSKLTADSPSVSTPFYIRAVSLLREKKLACAENPRFLEALAHWCAAVQSPSDSAFKSIIQQQRDHLLACLRHDGFKNLIQLRANSGPGESAVAQFIQDCDTQNMPGTETTSRLLGLATAPNVQDNEGPATNPGRKTSIIKTKP